MFRFSFDNSDPFALPDPSDQFGGGPYPVGLHDGPDSLDPDQLDFDVHSYDSSARGHPSEQEIVRCEPVVAASDLPSYTEPQAVGGCSVSSQGVLASGPGPFAHALSGPHSALPNFFSNQPCPYGAQYKLDTCVTCEQGYFSLESGYGGFGPAAGAHGRIFPSEWHANLPICQEASGFQPVGTRAALPADGLGLKRHGKNHAEPLNRWDDEWKTCFLKAVLSLGIGNAKTMSILEFMRMECPDRRIEKKHVESYWQNFRRKLRAQHGLSRIEVPKNEHLPKPKDIPAFLRHLADRWLPQ